MARPLLNPVISMAMAVGVSAASVFYHESLAQACEPTSDAVFPLLPEDGASGVPLNVSLQATSVLTRVSFELVEAETGTMMPVSESCDEHDVGSYCVARAELLKPATEYIWRALPDSDFALEPKQRSFVTGTSDDNDAPALDDWLLEVVSDEPEGLVGCSTGRLVTFRFAANEFAEPLVLTVAGLEPSDVQQAWVVPPTTPIQFALGEPPECLSIRLTDLAGNAYELPHYCWKSVAPPDSDAGFDAGAETSAGATTVRSDSSGCRMTAHSGSSWSHWLALVGATIALAARKLKSPVR
jgi:hypothetical protein